MTQLLAFLKKALFPLGLAAGAVAYDVPSSGHVNWRAVALVGVKTFLGALGVTVAGTSDAVKTAVAAVSKKAA